MPRADHPNSATEHLLCRGAIVAGCLMLAEQLGTVGCWPFRPRTWCRRSLSCRTRVEHADEAEQALPGCIRIDQVNAPESTERGDVGLMSIGHSLTPRILCWLRPNDRLCSPGSIRADRLATEPAATRGVTAGYRTVPDASSALTSCRVEIWSVRSTVARYHQKIQSRKAGS